MLVRCFVVTTLLGMLSLGCGEQPQSAAPVCIARDCLFDSKPQCDETYSASWNTGGIAKLSRIRFVSVAGVKPKSLLNSLLNCDGLV